MVKVKKELPQKSCKFETKIPQMGTRELKLSQDALQYLKVNSPVSKIPVDANEMGGHHICLIHI
ncbi:hypothetical protein NYE70_22140 [Paenibacillus sp. FSL R5-0407]|uniref:hypothetical protein n=1 Tax=unclassified Paenibacillus TaxID=185978 RepID=UPI0012FDD2C7|nr:hypothetical protein [Paenibacillus sp. RUD330]QID16105.1 hypothetical protein CIC07_25620 [Paenibacillus sp. RUD330]